MQIASTCWYVVLSLVWALNAHAQWDADAGLVPSWTDAATISVSAAGSNDPLLMTDGDDQTQWLSTNPLPQNYIARADQNVLLQQAAALGTSSGAASLDAITDGNLNTPAAINASGNRAWVALNFAQAQTLIWTHLKMQIAAGDTLALYAFTSDTDSSLLAVWTDADNYALLAVPLNGSWVRLRLYGTGPFSLFEWAAMADNPREWAVFDFGASHEVGYLKLRHWAGTGNAHATRVWLSLDGQSWRLVATLDPETLPAIPLQVAPPVQARYLKVEHELVAEDYRKAFIWEVDAWDAHGPYGPRPAAQPSTVTFSEMIGVNGIWGWGHNTYSTNLGPGQGPDLYNDFATHARNYHNWSWDVTDPDITPDYTAMAAGNGTQAQPWLNWDTEYGAWQAAGLDVGCTIQFNQWAPSVFDDPYAAAYNYGHAFATHFGPTNGNGLVSWIEAGNEPWTYDSATYRLILRGMAQGVEDADAALTMLPCALQALDPSAEGTASAKNYIGARITPQEAPLLDALNAHAYSFTRTADGTRIAVQPEHYDSGMRELYNLLRWRDANMPGTPVWLTEWGWDHDGGGESCTHSECVSEADATAWFTRALMQCWRLGIARALVYFYANTTDPSSTFTRSGVTGSALVNFQKKNTFRVLETLVNRIGDRYFLQVLREDDTAWIYALGDAGGTVTHVVAWRPVGSGQTGSVQVSAALPAAPAAAWWVDGQNNQGTPAPLPAWNNGTATFTLSATPQIAALSTAPLPVELSAWEVHCTRQTLSLHWTTLSERDSRRFVVWGSPDGRHWQPLDSVAAAGQSATTRHYALTVPAATTARYFRLFVEDRDGSGRWSDVATAPCTAPIALRAWPNPATDTFTLELQFRQSAAQPVTLSLTDMRGHIRYEQQWSAAHAPTQLRLSAKSLHLQPGVYLFRLRQGQASAFAKFVLLSGKR